MKKILFPALAALGLSVGPLQASTFTVDYQDASNPFGSGGLYAPVTISSEVYNGTFYAGQFAMSSDPLGDFFAFCIEVTQGLRNGHAYEFVAQPFDDAVLTNIEGLFNTAYDQVTNSVTSAAFQVALWEIVEDTNNGLDLNGGTFSAVDATSNGGSVVQTAQNFLAGLNDDAFSSFEVSYLLSPTSQDLVTANRVLAPAAVPLPAGGLLLLSAGGVLMASRKKARKAS